MVHLAEQNLARTDRASEQDSASASRSDLMLANYTLPDVKLSDSSRAADSASRICGNLELCDNSKGRTLSPTESAGATPGQLETAAPDEVKVADADGRVRNDAAKPSFTIERKNNPDGTSSETETDSNGQKTRERVNDPDGGWHETQYDPETHEVKKRIDHKVNPIDGSSTDTETDGQGRKTRERVTQPDGSYDEKKYDAETGLLDTHTTHEQKSDGSTVDTTDDMFGNKVVRKTDAKGNYTEEGFSANGESTYTKTHTVNDDGSTDDKTTDADGKVTTRHTDANGNFTEIEKDKDGNEQSRVVHRQNPDGSSDETTYQQGNKVESVHTNKDGSKTVTKYNPETGAVEGTESFDADGNPVESD